jgi:hypothetical protein
LNGCHIASERRRECFLAFHENFLGVRVLKYEAEGGYNARFFH